MHFANSNMRHEHLIYILHKILLKNSSPENFNTNVEPSPRRQVF